MSHVRRWAATLAIVFFSVLNAGTSQRSVDDDPSTGPAEEPTAEPAPQGDVDRFCHREAEGRCQSMRLSAGYEEQAEQLRCAQANGTWNTTPCDTSHIVGRCIAQNRRSAWYFSPPAWTEESASALCATFDTMTWAPGSQ